ncbi:immunoglobulin-binding protein 1-like isoform X2 [Littorina saxatilis]|uniref:immunoglobulin-binding protein 1-like isoform X2 n=1 Tax=Littorina saxatilis TaxID=31220 RepID=UPI0038B42D9B
MGEVRKAIAKTEQVIFMVNQLQLFSDNEEIEEVSSNEVKYMLLPALLAYFHNLNTHASRLETVVKAKSHYKDFLKMCKSYKVSSVHIPLDVEDDEESESSAVVPASNPSAMDMQVMGLQRNSKIERFKQNKEYDSRLKELLAAVEKDTVDDEVKREFYLTQIKRWINTALDEIESLNMEIQILQHMAAMKKQGKGASSGGSDGAKGAKPTPKKAFRPFILTKDAIQKKVFGLGYPGVPTMTIEEFYAEKVQDGTFSIPNSGPASGSLQGRASDPDADAREMEGEDAQREKREEEDDADLLQGARNMDAYKDDHRRGWGNRHNMG